MPPREWTKSSYSGQDSSCVQWRRSPQGPDVEIGDSKAPDGPTLTVTPDAWARFIRFAAAL